MKLGNINLVENDKNIDTFKEEDALVKRIHTLTTNKDTDGNKIPSYCYIKDLRDEFKLSDDKIIKLAKKEGCKVYKAFSNEEVDGGFIIAHEKCNLKMIKDEFKKNYGVDVEIEEIDSIKSNGPKYERLLKSSPYIKGNKKRTKESVNKKNIDIQTQECLVLENIEKHETLNPKLWNEDNTLKSEVREKILQIAKEFTNELEKDGIKFELDDIRLVGSNCSYNYNDKSDLDIHLIMDTKSLECPDNLYPLLYSAYRSLFNKKLDIDFYGVPVEIYVETE